MAPLIDQPRPEPIREFPNLQQEISDVPGLTAGLTGDIYAAEERADRIARTERLIQEAQQSN